MNYEKYKTKLKYPSPKDFTTHNVYHLGEVLLKNGTKEQEIAIRKEYSSALFEAVVDNEAYKKARQEYTKEEERLIDEFWKDVFEEIGIPLDHPKAAKLRSKAWQEGHSNGLSEVYYHLEDLWEFLSDD